MRHKEGCCLGLGETFRREQWIPSPAFEAWNTRATTTPSPLTEDEAEERARDIIEPLCNSILNVVDPNEAEDAINHIASELKAVAAVPSVVGEAVNPMEPHVFQRTLWNVACCAVCNGAADGKLHQMRSSDFDVTVSSSSAEIARRIAEKIGNVSTKVIGGTYSFDAERAIAIIESELAATPTETGWRDIESAPKDGTEVLLWWPYWRKKPIIGRWNTYQDNGFWDTKAKLIEYGQGVPDNNEDPLMWAPLPPLPAPPESRKS